VSSLRPLDVRGASVALLLAALWGANPVAIKLGLADAPPLRLAWMRFVLGGLTILAYALWTRRGGMFRLRRGEAAPIASLGLLFAVQITLMHVGIGLSSAAHGAVLLNAWLLQIYRPSALAAWALTSPIWGVLVAWAMLASR